MRDVVGLRCRARRRDMLGGAKRWVVVGAVAGVLAAQSCANGWEHLGNVQKVEKRADGVELTAGKAKVRLTFFREGIVRVRVSAKGEFAKDRSWAIIETPETVAVNVKDERNEVRVASGGV